MIRPEKLKKNEWEGIATILLYAIDETRSCSKKEMYQDLIHRGIPLEVLEYLAGEDKPSEEVCEPLLKTTA